MKILGCESLNPNDWQEATGGHLVWSRYNQEKNEKRTFEPRSHYWLEIRDGPNET